MINTYPLSLFGFTLAYLLLGIFQSPGSVFIGGVGGLDEITQTHINNLLSQHGISVLMEGSLSYGIQVPAKQAEQAMRLLREDLRMRTYWIWMGNKQYTVPATEWHAYSINKAIRRLQSAVDKRVPMQVLSILRDSSFRKYPYLTRLHIRKRDYLDQKSKYEIGYEGEVYVAASLSPNTAGKQQQFQVYNNGHRVVLLSSVEWRR